MTSMLSKSNMPSPKSKASVGAPEIFAVWSDGLEGRFDAPYYRPYLRELLNQVLKQKHYRLGDVITEMTGGATPEVTGDFYMEEGGVPFLRVQNVTEMGIDLDDVKYIKPEVHETMLKRSQLKKDDLVFTITGRIGSVAVVPDGFVGNINQHSVRFHLRPEIDGVKILPEYVAAFFNTKAGRDLSLRYTTGGTRPALDYEGLKNLVFPLPSEKKQKEIVAELQEAYEKKRAIEKEAEKIIASVDTFVLGELGITATGGAASRTPEVFAVWNDVMSRRLDPMFFHPARLAAIKAVKECGLPLKPLAEVADFRRELVDEIPEGMSYIGLENVASGSGELVDTGEKEGIGTAFVFKKGDVLFPKLRPYLNKVYYADHDGVCSTEFHVLKAKACSPEYLFAFLSRSVIVEQTSRLMTGNTLPRLQTEDIEELFIPLPSEQKQGKIVAGLKSLLEKARTLQASATTMLSAAQEKSAQAILS